MKTKILFTTMNGNIIYKVLWPYLILSIIFALFGCSDNTVTAGKDGISIKGGEWIGNFDDGNYMMQFNIGTDGANIFLLSYSFPCDGKISYVLPPKPIKIELNNSAFEMTIDYSDLSPKLVLTGKFVDSTHVEGTWEIFKYQNIYLDTSCSAAKGTWKGSKE